MSSLPSASSSPYLVLRGQAVWAAYANSVLQVDRSLWPLRNYCGEFDNAGA